MEQRRPIGVFDSGVGGFSVVRELQRQLPGEDLIYFGDSAHVPYGSKRERQLLGYVERILAFMGGRNVKAVVVACNTTSSLIERYRGWVPFPVFGIIETSCAAIAALDAGALGVIGTPFTARLNLYGALIARLNPRLRVIAAGCPNLARLIEEGRGDDPLADAELRQAVAAISARAEISHLVLGCTHYPLIAGRVARLFPRLTLIDPAREQVAAVRRSLGGSAPLVRGESGALELNTSGDPASFAAAAERFALRRVSSVNRLDITEEIP